MSFQQLLSKSCDPSAKALFSCSQYQDCLRLSLCLCSFPGPPSAGLLETFTCLPSGRRLCRHLIVCYSATIFLCGFPQLAHVPGDGEASPGCGQGPRKEALLGSLSPVAHFSSPLKQKSAIAFNAFPPHPLSTQYSCQDPP